MSLIGKIIRFVIEKKAAKKELSILRNDLRTSSKTVAERMRSAADTRENRGQASHLTGIERWAQPRLRVFLGEKPVEGEYNGYRPSQDLNMAAQARAFSETRAATLDLIAALEKATIPDTQTVPHNDLGQLSLRGWLMYLESHANRESLGLKS
jgi:hypothetical protein